MRHGGISSAQENHSAPARGFQALKQQRQQSIDPRRQLRVAPFLRMGGMVEAAGGVKQRARGWRDIGDLEYALLDAFGEDMVQLIDQAVLVRLPDLAVCLRKCEL